MLPPAYLNFLINKQCTDLFPRLLSTKTMHSVHNVKDLQRIVVDFVNLKADVKVSIKPLPLHIIETKHTIVVFQLLTFWKNITNGY